jgi:hypothetical protein
MTSQQELRVLLRRATADDLERLVAALDRWPRPTRVAVSFDLASAHADQRPVLEEDLVTEIQRCAAAPLSRSARSVLRRPVPDDLHEVITLSASRLGVGVKVPPGGTFTGRLAALSGALVDRAVRDLPPAEQQRLGVEVLDRVEPRSRGAADLARAAAAPALHQLLGPAVLARVMESVLVQVSSLVVGRHVARAAVGAALARVPLGAALGPLAWGSGAALVAWELQKPALRKLVPAFVTLGFVALRRE